MGNSPALGSDSTPLPRGILSPFSYVVRAGSSGALVTWERAPGLVTWLPGDPLGGSRAPGGSLVLAVFLEHRRGWGFRVQGPW